MIKLSNVEKTYRTDRIETLAPDTAKGLQILLDGFQILVEADNSGKNCVRLWFHRSSQMQHEQ